MGHHWRTGKKYEVMDVDSNNGSVSVLTSNGEVKDDLNLPKTSDGDNDEVAQSLIEKFENGDDLKITVLTIMGEETIIEVS